MRIGTMNPSGMVGLGAAAILALSAWPTPSFAAKATRPSCSDPSPACTVAWAAKRSGIFAGTALDSDPSPAQVGDTTTNFNALTTENSFKWSSMEATRGSIDFSATDQQVSFAESNHLRLRAHTLFWHRLQIPSWVRSTVESAADPKAKLKELMTARVNAVVGRYRGRIAIWDVVNEPTALFGAGWDTADTAATAKNFLYTTAGEQYIVDAFKAARAADPKAKLFLNELVWNPAIGDPKADFLLELVKRLRAKGAPIDGVGLQMHAMFGAKEPLFSGSTAKLTSYMKALVKAGVKVEVTELDVSLPLAVRDLGSPSMTDPQRLALQADVYRRVVRACAATSGCTGVTVWGLRDDDTWLDGFPQTAANAPNRPLMLAADGSRKPAYGAVRDSLLERCPRTGRQRTPCSTPWPAAVR